MIELFECARMHARISKAACKNNRALDMVSCFGCKGLGAATIINLEGKSMGGSVCNYKGCNKAQVVKGFCTGHARQEGFGQLVEDKYKERNAAYRSTRNNQTLQSQSLPAVAEKTSAPVVTTIELNILDLANELDLLFAAKRNEWLEDLQGATSIRSRARLFLGMADALEGMGY